MDYLRSIIRFLFLKFTKAQLVVIAVILFFAFFVGESSVFNRFGYERKISDLNRQITYYQSLTASNMVKINELKSNKDNVEKFARENYLMKKPNEDIFVINK